MKKVLVALLTFVMIVTGFVCLNPKASEVKAATETELSADGNYVTVAKGKWNEDAKGVPVLDGYLFAGYFKEKDCTLETRTSKAGAKYAKFVKEDVLDVKIQITNGTVKSSYETDKNGDTPYVGKHVIRFVSSVDSLNYKNIGFELEFKDAEGNVQKLSTKTTKTFKRIASTIGADQSGADTYSFSPKMVSEDSLNFFTAKLPVENTAEAMATVYKVRAFWTTLDGTVIRGQERAVSVNDTQENVVNMSVKTSLDLSKATVTYGPNAEGTGASGKKVTVLTSENGVVNVRVELADGETKDELKSATKFVFTIGDDTASAVYRNYYTTHAPRTGGGSATPDITWYTVNPEGTVFQIASSADMYGLAKIVNDGLTTFEDKEINVIRDIVLNEGIAKRSDGSTAPTWVKATIGDAEASLCEWTAIGGEWGSSGINTSNPTKFFNGRFDGCGHTISGMRETYYAPGFFGYAGPKAEICNFKLVNSFIDVLSGAAKVSGIVAAGCPKKIENVYTDMVISSKKNFASAFLGQIVNGRNGNDLTEITINNCWFDGEMYLVGTTADSYSPFVAYASKKYIDLKLTNCLFTGTVNGAYKNYGTFFGHTSYGGTIKITLDNCMSMGNINLAENASACGAVFANANSVVTLNNVYINEANGPQKIYNTNTASTYKANNVQCVNRDTMLSLDSITDKFPLLSGETESPWVCDSASNSTDRGTPVLRTFASWWAERYQVTPDTSWYNKDDVKSEYVIETAEQLYGLAEISKTFDFANVEIKLGADIELNKANPITVKKWRNGLEVPMNSWTPIGDSDTAFAGTFDGQGHKISGLYYNGTGDYIGLFSYTSTTSKVKNVSVIDSYIKTTGTTVGSVIAQSLSLTVEDVYSNAIIDAAKGFAGGIVGRVYGVSGGSADDYYWNGTGTKWNVKNAWFDGEIVSYAGKNYFGGIVGGLPNATILTLDNCLYTGEITGSGALFVGGIVGGNNNSSTCNINNCLSLGTINNGAVSGAAFYGYINAYYTQINVSNSYTTITNYGLYNTKASVRPNHFAVTGDFANLQTRDWLLAADEDTILPMLEGETANAWVNDKTTGWNNTDRGTPILSAFADLWAELEHDEFTVDISWYDENKDEFKLGTAAELRGFAELAKTHNFANKIVKLGANIELNPVNEKILADWKQRTKVAEFNWTPIGTSESAFAGTFDGQGYTISGLYLNATTEKAGMFGTVAYNAEIKNFKLIDSYMTSTKNYLGLVGSGFFKKLENVYSDAYIETSALYASGFIAEFVGCDVGQDGYDTRPMQIDGCWFDGEIVGGEASQNLGGFIAYRHSLSVKYNMSNCLFTGKIKSTYAGSAAAVRVGAFAAWINKYGLYNIENCLAVGTLDTPYNNVEGATVGAYGSHNTNYKTTGSYTYACDMKFYGVDGGNAWKGTETTRADVINTDVTVLFPNSTAWQNDIGYNAVDRGTPILKHFANWWLARQPETELLDRADTSWYTSTEAGKTYVLDTAAKLYGFAILGQTNSFAGQTIKLGADIELNEVDADVLESWKNGTEPFMQWKAVGTSSVPFAGTFDGQNHIISGLYLNTETTKSGMFGTVTYDAEIKNFKLVDSYMTSTQTYLGLIGSGFVKTIENVYSNAYIYAPAGYASGFIADCTGYNMVHDGYTERPMNIKNCWFDGEIDGGNVGLAGFIATKGGSVSAVINISDCLFTGNIKCSVSDAKVRVGTFYGVISRYGYYNFDNCLSVGKVEIAGQDATSAVGFYDGQNLSTAGSYTYVCDGKWIGNQGTTKPGTLGSETTRQNICEQDVSALFPESDAWMNDNEGGWNDTDRGTPILASFAEWWIENVEHDELTVDFSWYDEDTTEFTLTTADQLYNFAQLAKIKNFAGQTVKLGTNIVLNEVDETILTKWENGSAIGRTWTPVGTATNPFAGTFDGQGYEVSGLYLNTTANAAGFFGTTAATANLTNFKLIDSYMKSTNDAVGLIGSGTFAEIEKVYTNAIISVQGNNVGGFIGCAYGSGTDMCISNCWFDGAITQTWDASVDKGTQGAVAGFVGKTAEATGGLRPKFVVNNCLNTGNVSGYTRVGGFIGWHAYGDKTTGVLSTWDNCLMVGSVVAGKAETVGSMFVGDYNTSGKTAFTASYTTGDVVVQGVQKTNATCNTDAVKTRYDLYMADLATLFPGSDAWVQDTGYNDTDRGTPILATFAEWWTGRQDEGAIEAAPSTAWYTAPETDGEYIIQNKGDLLGFLSLAKKGETFDGKTIKLGANITLNTPDVNNWKAGKNLPAYQWTPVTFNGNFDGQGHSISGVYVKSNSEAVGFFGKTAAGSSISNFRLLDSYVEQSYASGTWSHFTGSIVGDAAGDITNVYSNATMVSPCHYTSGIVGIIRPALASDETVAINNCWFDGTIELTKEVGYIGGIVGYQENGTLNLTNVLYTGHIKGNRPTTDKYGIGGIIGQTYNTVTATNLESVVSAGTFDIPNGTKWIGSVAGYFYSGVDETDTSTYTLNNVFANRGLGTPFSWGGGNGTLTGKVIQTSNSDRLLGYIPQSIAGMDAAQKLDFTTNKTWTMRTNDVPVLTVFKDLVDARDIVAVDSLTAANLTSELGLGTINGSFANAVADGAGDYVVRVTGSETNYNNYLAQLASLGFTKFVDNAGTTMATDGIYAATYCKAATSNKGEWVVNVTYVKNDGKIYVSINSDVESVANTLLNDDTKNPLGKEDGTNAISLSMIEDKANLLITGNCFVFQLPNGHFIINDGNTNDGGGAILKAYLESIVGEGNPIYVDAWVITHFHNDHGGALMDMANNASLREKLYVDAFYVNEASMYAQTAYTAGGDAYKHTYSILDGASKLKRSETNSASPVVYQVHMGQRYYLNGITLDVVNTPEQLADTTYSGSGQGAVPDGFNTTSVNIVYTLQDTGKRVLIGGDTTQVMMTYMMNAYGKNSSGYGTSQTLANINAFAAYHHGKNVMNKYYEGTHITKNGVKMHVTSEGNNKWADYLLKNTNNASGFKFDVMFFPNFKQYQAAVDPSTACTYSGCDGRVVGDDGGTVYPYNVTELNQYYADNATLHFTTGYQDSTAATADDRHGTVKINFNEGGSITYEAYASVHRQTEPYTFEKFVPVSGNGIILPEEDENL